MTATGDGRTAAAAQAKRRSSFALCLFAALLLTLSAILGAVAWNATDASLFRDSIRRNVDLAALGVSEADADAFAAQTIAYLRDDLDAWQPRVVMNGRVMPVPQAFGDHMAGVKNGFSTAKALAVALAALAFLLLLWSALQSDRLSWRGYVLGAALPLLALACAGLWASLDFNGFWSWLHVTFIPDGLFDAGTEIMALFPSNLFLDYGLPVARSFALCLAVIAALPLLLTHAVRRFAARSGADRSNKANRGGA